MFNKRLYAVIFASALLGALCMLVLTRYKELPAAAIVLGAAICGGVISLYGRAGDVLFREEALEILTSLKHELRRHTEGHSSLPYDEESTHQQIARQAERIASIEQSLATSNTNLASKVKPK